MSHLKSVKLDGKKLELFEQIGRLDDVILPKDRHAFTLAVAEMVAAGRRARPGTWQYEFAEKQALLLIDKKRTQEEKVHMMTLYRRLVRYPEFLKELYRRMKPETLEKYEALLRI